MSEHKSKMAELFHRWKGYHQIPVTELNTALDADMAELRRLRDAAMQSAYDNAADIGDLEQETKLMGIQAYEAQGMETAARLLGRELPPWVPGKEAK